MLVKKATVAIFSGFRCSGVRSRLTRELNAEHSDDVEEDLCIDLLETHAQILPVLSPKLFLYQRVLSHLDARRTRRSILT